MEYDLARTIFAAMRDFAEEQPIAIGVFYPNVSGDPRTGDTSGVGLADINRNGYLAPSILPVEPEDLHTSGQAARFIWLINTVIAIPKNKGELPAKRIADNLRAAFPRTHVFVAGECRFIVITTASLAPSIQTDAWHEIPVRFRVQTIT